MSRGIKETLGILYNVYTILITFLCVYLLIEWKGTNELLKAEVRIKYEYSLIIDSLISERDNEIEGMRHWQELNETENQISK